MPTLSALTLFLLAALGLLLIPGPTVMFILTRSAAQGKRAGLVSVAGIELASLTHAVAATLGLSALLLSSVVAFSIAKYLGAGCLIYLSVRALLTRRESEQIEVPTPQRISRLFSQGFLVQLLNPKTALFFYAFLPQFVDPARAAVAGQILVFGVAYVLSALCTHSLYVLVGSTAGRVLTRSIGFRRGQRYVTGGIYLVLAVMAAMTGSVTK